MYESPITLIVGEIETHMENECYKAVQRYGFEVDKEELKKALAYDRDQYNKGFEDGKKIARPTGEWIDHSDEVQTFAGFRYEPPMTCSRCGRTALNEPWHFCPNCGSDMRKEEE